MSFMPEVMSRWFHAWMLDEAVWIYGRGIETATYLLGGHGANDARRSPNSNFTRSLRATKVGCVGCAPGGGMMDEGRDGR